MYVKGCTPGDTGEVLVVKDTMIEEKRIKDPPFPTYYADPSELEKEQALTDIHLLTSKDICSPTLFRFNQTSVVFTEADETKTLTRDKTKAKTAKIRK